MILSAIGASTIGFYLVLVPLIAKFASDIYGTFTIKLNYRFSQFYMIAHTFGALGMGLATSQTALVLSVLFLSAGTGFRQSWVSVLIADIDESCIATLSTIVSFLETVGSLLGAPLLGAAASKGFEFEGILMGLPFFTASASYASLMIKNLLTDATRFCSSLG